MGKKPKKRALTDKQEMFCQFYTKYWNATRAAKEAGYSEDSAGVQGYQLLQIPLVKSRIEELKEPALREIGVSRERVLLEAARIAYFDPKNALDKIGQPKQISEMDEDTRRCVSSIEITELFDGRGEDRQAYGQIKNIKFTPKKVGLDILQAATDLSVQKHEHSGPNGKPIEHKSSDLTDEQLEARLKSLLEKKL